MHLHFKGCASHTILYGSRKNTTSNIANAVGVTIWQSLQLSSHMPQSIHFLVAARLVL